MTAIVDYGVGNLFSLRSSLEFIGARVTVTDDHAVLHAASRIILPGVGAFGDAARRLRESGLDSRLKDEAARGKPLLGICLGMQLLFERSFEYGQHAGLGLIPGSVRSIRPRIAPEMKLPHIGWNALSFPRTSPLFKSTAAGEHVYFVHSYAAMECDEHVIAVTEYEAELTAAVARGNVYGTQFHPEKSGDTGMKILRAFCGI
ncbi:MAG: imidazole glycerol phosphate synthase subunit HisH [Oscillospiraceae bacterium]|jgi:glutamine amidotransferase|nr:imidazole glycerol phosphate synthase subunit HisH [Oscillospiraceae bacterium]